MELNSRAGYQHHRIGCNPLRGDSVYCIYSNKDVPDTEGSWDHVFPLALGGKNQFTVWSDNYSNSIIGSKVDAPVAKDVVVELALHKSGVQGHRAKRHGPRWRRVSMEGNPIQVTWASDQIRVWDLKCRRELADDDIAGKSMEAIFHLRPNSLHRFLAKIALGGGYLIYGNDFIDAVNCNPLRSLMFLDMEEARRDEHLTNSEIKICDRFHPDSRSPVSGGIFRILCESIGRTILISTPQYDCISFHVGVVGVFLGSIIVPAKTESLPIDGDHDLGHAIMLESGDYERCSFRALCADFLRSTGRNLPDSPGLV